MHQLTTSPKAIEQSMEEEEEEAPKNEHTVRQYQQQS